MKECAGLKDYLTKAMERQGREQFEAHMRECTACARAVEADRAISTALNAVPKVNAPRYFVERVMREVAIRRRSRLAWAVYGVAVMAVAALVGVLLGGDVLAVAEKVTVLTRSLADFGGSLYTVVHNISAVLLSTLPVGRMAPTLAGGVFVALCAVFYKTVFSFSGERK